MDFLTKRELESTRPTKGELAARLYPEDKYNVDMAIPQNWLDDAYARGMDAQCEGTNLAGHFVSVYPRDGSPMFIAPITADGVRIIAILATVKR